MVLPILEALGALVVILAACELFTNGIEWLGCRLNLSPGVVGSVLAAVGTALPETLVPIAALVFVGGAAARDIGVGAILGAPFMLATLAFAVTGLSAWVFRAGRPSGTRLAVDARSLGQDFRYFFIVYLLAIGASFVLAALRAQGAVGAHLVPVARGVIVVALLGAYFYYVRQHLLSGDDPHSEEGLAPLYFQRRCETAPRFRFVGLQVLVALAAILGAAHVFVGSLCQLSQTLGLPPLILSIIVTPLATELPEKCNSVLWVRRGKDTLALGNVSGAMVFQSCIPVAIGVGMTEWILTPTALASAVVALLSAAIVYTCLRRCGELDARLLLIGLPLYAAFLLVAFRP